MTGPEMEALVERYFAAIDGQDRAGLAAVLAEDCVLTIETHGITKTGRDAVIAIFEGRWGSGTTVRHHGFTHTASPEAGRIASQFTVSYVHADGSTDEKSNANVFSLRDGVFSGIAVYMAGANTIRAAD